MPFAKEVLHITLQVADNEFVCRKPNKYQRNKTNTNWMLHRLFLQQFCNTKRKLHKTTRPNKSQMERSELENEVRSSPRGVEKRNLVIFPENGVTKVPKEITCWFSCDKEPSREYFRSYSYTRYKLGFLARPVHEDLVTVYGDLHLLFAQLLDGFSILLRERWRWTRCWEATDVCDRWVLWRKPKN